MELSVTQQLDVAGMQPHSREYLEHMVSCDVSRFKAMMTPGVMHQERAYDEHWHKDGTGEWRDYHPDPMPGIHYGDTP